jgi:hypothetical protein
VNWKGDTVETVQKLDTTPAETPAPEATPTEAAPERSAPVSDAIEVGVRGKLATYVNGAIDAIDLVHDDGALPTIPLKSLKSERALGTYSFTNSGEARKIEIKNAPTSWPGLTTAHEIGHFIDHQVLGTKGQFASSSHELLADFREVVEKTAAVKQLREEQPSWSEFLKPYELWARAYAQYIATVSADVSLLTQLDKVRSSRQPWRQWSDEDFTPVKAAIDAVLRKKGWIK